MIDQKREISSQKSAQLEVLGYSCRSILGLLGLVSAAIASIDRSNDPSLFENLSSQASPIKPFGEFQLNAQNAHSTASPLNSHEKVLFAGFQEAFNSVVEQGSSFSEHRNHAAINDSFRSLVAAADRITRLRFIDELASSDSKNQVI